MGFAVLAVSFEGRLGGIDADLADWVASDLPGAFGTLARPFSWLGGWIGLTILGVVVGICLIRERAWLDLAFFVTAFLGSQLVVSLLKDGFDRDRPAAGSAVPLPESASFPSGHATAGWQAWAPWPFYSPSVSHRVKLGSGYGRSLSFSVSPSG